MMKFTQALNVAVASVLVVPAVTLQGGAADSLHQSLDRTLLALETLSGLGERLQLSGPSLPPERATEVVESVLAHTEPALPADLGTDPADPAARDQLLDALRTDVAMLQAKLDSAQPGTTPIHKLDLPLTDPSEALAPKGVTTGLDDNMRALLAARGKQKPVATPVVQPKTPSAAQQRELKAAMKVNFEADGFTADPLKLAQAYYRAGKYTEAVEVLELHASGAEALYWQARSLEKLGDHEAAVATYTAVSELEDAGPLKERALEDIEFLKWRLDFEQQTKGKQVK